MAYVQYAADGVTVTGVFANPQGFPTSLLSDADPAVVAFLTPSLAPPTVASLLAYAAAKRFALETGGITVGGVLVDTSRDSQAMISNAYAYIVNSGVGSIAYKANSGWVMLDAATIKAIALAIGTHVQNCFTSEQAIDVAINAGTITTTAQIDAAAWAV